MKPKLIEFKIESKKKEIIFQKLKIKNFKSKIIEKNLKKIVTYKESKITSSLYSTAIKLGIKPNIIIEFARFMVFKQIFKEIFGKDDSFKLFMNNLKMKMESLIENGEIIFANLNIQGNDLNLYKFEYEKMKLIILMKMEKV